MYKSIFLNQHWVYLFTLQVMLAMTLLRSDLKTVCANAVTPEIPTVSDNENDFMIPVDEKEEEYGGDLYTTWGGRSDREEDLNADMMPIMVLFGNPATMEDGNMNDENIFNQKRGWKKMNVAWGKRRNAGQYMNRAAGSWGKREPNWNNLKGMWGKRAITTGMLHKRATSKGGQWNYLRGSWGKRSAQFPETN